jgi:hypothetical protein
MQVSVPGRLGLLLVRVTRLAFLLAALLLGGLAVLSWRLAQGLLPLPWLVRQLEASANTDGSATRLNIGGAALAWEVFGGEAGRSLDIFVTDIAVFDTTGTKLASVPRARVSLSLRRLLLGAVVNL